MGVAIVGLVVILGFVLYWLLQILLIPFLLVAIKCVEGDKIKYSKEDAEDFLKRHQGQEVKVPAIDRLAESLGKPYWAHVLSDIDVKHKRFIFEDGTKARFDEVLPFYND